VAVLVFVFGFGFPFRGRKGCSEDSKCIYANPLTPGAGEPLRLLGLPFCLGFPVSGTEGVWTLAVKAHLSFFRTPVRGRNGRALWTWFPPSLSTVIILLLLLSSCSQNRSADNTNAGEGKIYKGELKVDVDPGLEHVMKLQQEVFEYQHDSVKLNIQYRNESDMLSDFRTGKATMLVMTRALDSNEIQSLIKQDTIYVREIKVAHDAVALIGNKSFNDSSLDIETLKKYFDPANISPDVPQMVFEDQHSSVVKFMLNKLGYKGQVSSHVYALKSTEEVIDYVKKSNNSIGFIPFNFLSNLQNEDVKKIYDSVKVISLRTVYKDGSVIRVSANQSDIATGDYPLTRNIYTEMRLNYADNLEWLFANFLFRERGGRIFLEDGLMPANFTPLDVDVNTDGLKAKN
jgi:phosphate transport system substrate-binding protein